MTSAGRVVVIGDALIDELRGDGGIREFVGGAALTVAVGLTRLGVPATLIAMVGDDEAGDHIRSYLRDFGVELLETGSVHGSARVVSVRQAAGAPEVEVDAAGRARRVRFGDAERQAVADAAAVVVSGFPFDDVAQGLELADVVAVTGAPLVVDPRPRAGLLADRSEFVRGFEQLAVRAALVCVGEGDAALLYGIPLDEVRARLADLGPAAVLANYGPAGAAIEAGDVVVTKPVSELPGRVVDTMGADEALLAAVVASLVAGELADDESWDAALQRAMDVAAATARFEGALLRHPSSLAGPDLDRLGT